MSPSLSALEPKKKVLRPPAPEGQALARLRETLLTVRRENSGLSVLAIRWMHLKHPLHPVQSALLRDSASAARGVTTNGAVYIVRVIRGGLYALWLSARLLWLQWSLRRVLARFLDKRFAVIAKTCCLDGKRPENGVDFYYGDLALRLAPRGIPVLLICGDVFDRPWRSFIQGQLTLDPVPRLPEMCLVPPLEPIRVFLDQVRSSWRLTASYKQEKDQLAASIKTLAARDCFLADTMHHALNRGLAEFAVRRWRPRAFVTFYEGHAWERCAWQGVKDADPACRTIGYQHSMLFPEAKAMTEPSVDTPLRSLPDAVLCLGALCREILEAGHARYPVKLFAFGSFRSRGEQGIIAPTRKNRHTVLVIPSGIAEETHALFDFAHACAKQIPGYTFLLRRQPGTPIPGVEEALKRYSQEQSNIIVSTETDLAADIGRSAFALYRDSSAVLYAMLQGSRPIYVEQDALTDTDPLYMLEGWRRSCASPQGLKAILEKDEHQEARERDAEWLVAAERLKRYVTPVKDEAMNAWLSWLGLNGEAKAHV